MAIFWEIAAHSVHHLFSVLLLSFCSFTTSVTEGEVARVKIV